MLLLRKTLRKKTLDKTIVEIGEELFYFIFLTDWHELPRLELPLAAW